MKTSDKNYSLIIRPAEAKDAGDINIMRRMPGLIENLLALPSESIAQNEDFISKRCPKSDHLFSAQVEHKGQSRVIGMAGLHVEKLPRERHSASLGIMVHSDFHRQGIGKKLMDALIDLSDNWLALKRLELTVFPDNLAAIKLYEKYGFVVEGIKKYASIRYGKYADIVLMARYNGMI